MRIWLVAVRPIPREQALAILPGARLAMLVMLRSGLKRSMEIEGGEAPPARQAKEQYTS